MGLFDFLFRRKKEKKENIENVEEQLIQDIQDEELDVPRELQFTKRELRSAIRSLAALSNIFRDSPILKATGTSEKMIQRINLFAGILGYVFQNVNQLGKYEDLVDEVMLQEYDHAKKMLDNEEGRLYWVKELSKSWPTMMTAVELLKKVDPKPTKTLNEMTRDLENLTKLFEELAKIEAKKPETRYEKMVRTAKKNPLNVTLEWAGSKKNPKYDLKKLGADIINVMNNKNIRKMAPNLRAIFLSYVFTHARVYAKKHGSLPISALDSIIEQCYLSVRHTNAQKILGSFASLKEDIYKRLLS